MQQQEIQIIVQDGEYVEDMQHHEDLMEISAQEEVIIKEIDEKPVLPQIPFSFPGQTFDTKCQKLILNVWDFFKRMKKNPDIFDEIRTPQERAAAALHISAATIGKIGKSFKRTGKLETPGAQRKRQRPVVDSVSAEDEDVIREIIAEMRAQKTTPTLPSVLAEARVRINFMGGPTSFRRILARMGHKNLSQKNIVKPKVVEIGQQQQPQQQFILQQQPMQALKIIKKESTMQSQGVGASGNIASTSTANIIQIANTGSGQPIQIADGTIINGTQTFLIQQPDNTLKPIHIVYTNSNLS